VEKDERGVVFDSHHPSWRKLLALVVTKGFQKEQKFGEELKKKQPDMYAIRQHCRREGVPEAHRGEVWTHLLEEIASQAHCGRPRGDFSKLLPLDDPGLRVIKADVSRTFPYNDMFQKPEVQRELETLLSCYCREYGVQYKQGMNFIFAVFFQIGLPDTRARYHAACLFMETMTGGTFKDSDFGGLQSVFRVFRLLLMYHDPLLCKFLDQYDMVPELYASSWFITLHANRVPINMLVKLWDHLLLDRLEHRLLHIFVSLGLIIKRRKLLMSEEVVTLPERLSRLAIQSINEADELVEQARKKYRPDTPQSVRTQLLSIASRPTSITSPEYLLLESMHCLMVSAEEVVSSSFENDDKMAPMSPRGGNSSPRGGHGSDGGFGSVKYFILDCRPEEEYRSGHLACAYHLDPELLFHPDRLQTAAKALAAMRGCHFCLCSDRAPPSRNDSPCTMLVLFLLQKGFKFISRLDGGYAACHDVIHRRWQRRRRKLGNQGQDTGGGFELLVDHDPEKCLECVKLRSSRKANAGRLTPRGARSPKRFLGILGNRLTDMLFGAGATSPAHVDDNGKLKSPRTNALSPSSSPRPMHAPGSEIDSKSIKSDEKGSIGGDTKAAVRLYTTSLRAGRICVLCGKSEKNLNNRRRMGILRAGGGGQSGIQILTATLRASKIWSPLVSNALKCLVGRLVDAGIELNDAPLTKGWEAASTPAIVGAITKSSDADLFEQALEPYGRVVRGQLARFRPGGSASKAAAGRWGSNESSLAEGSGGFGDTLPPKFHEGMEGPAYVLLYIMNASNSDVLTESVCDLASRGAHACLLTLSISRTTAGMLMMRHPRLRIVTIMEEYTSTETNEALPLIRLERLMLEDGSK